jgi:hypothetical protein
MDVTLLVTRGDFCVASLEHELHNLAVDYHIEYIENHPELVSAYHIRHSPNVFVDGQLIFRYQPTSSELKSYFSH